MALKWADGNGGRKDVLSLPTASTDVKGGIKVGQNLYMTAESLNAAPMGGVSFGGGLYFDDGVLGFDPLVGLPIGGGLSFNNGTLTFDPLDGLPVGEGLYFDNGTLNAAPAAYWCASMADFPANPELGTIAIADNKPYFYGGASWLPFCPCNSKEHDDSSSP